MDESWSNLVKNFFAGGISGCISKTVTAPIDRVKLLMQTQRTNTQVSQKYTSSLECMNRIYVEEGPLSFWRGNGANLIKHFPNQASNFALKDLYTYLIKTY